MKKYKNIKYFAVSNIENVSEVNLICDVLPEHVSFVPKIETLKGVLNLKYIFNTGKVKYIMLDSEDLYTDINNDVQLYLYLKNRVKDICKEYKIKLLELYGVIFK
jgi:pyruvate kinase